MLRPEAALADMGQRLQRLVEERYTWRAAALALHDGLSEVIKEARR
jgi:hypothetical protein